MDTVKIAILNTFTYFDLFDYPLTSVEAWKFLFWPNGQAVRFEEIMVALDGLSQAGKIEFRDGFYYLAGRVEIINLRALRHRLSIPKMQLARREARRLMRFPGTLGVAINNSLAYRNSRVGGDIDFFIITRANAIWQARGAAAAYTAFFDKRPRPTLKQNQICLCFFAALSALNLESYLLPDEYGLPDIDFIYRLAMMKPICGDGSVWDKFYAANQWLARFLPNLQFKFAGEMETRAAASVPSGLERILSKLQINFLPRAMRLAMNQGREVVTSFEIIKLHQNNGRAEIRERFLKRIKV